MALPWTSEDCYHPAFAPSLATNKDVHLKAQGVLLVMWSSAAVAARALIMLACAVGIPVVALWGASWSEMVKKIEDFHWTSAWNLAGGALSASQDEAVPFAPAKPANPQTIGNVAVQSSRAEVLSQGSQPLATAAPQNQIAASSGVVPAGYQQMASSAALVRSAVENASDAGHSAADPFSTLQDRLRRLGATYYLLESWGSQQQMYRFYCKMAIGGNADYTRYFEAIDADPLRAMLGVVRQVEAWRDGSWSDKSGTGK